jgi:glutaredoxin-like protein
MKLNLTIRNTELLSFSLELFIKNNRFFLALPTSTKPLVPFCIFYYIMLFNSTEAAEIAFVLEQRLHRPLELFVFANTTTETGADCLHIATSVSELTPKVRLHHIPSLDNDTAKRLNIRRLPAFVVMDENHNHHGIVHYGVPAGYDFAAFLNTLTEVSQGKADLCPGTRARLSTLDQAVHLQVFVGPKCPFCPIATHFANQFSIASELISAETINTYQFPDWVEEFQIQALPTVLINNTVRMIGIPAESTFLDHVFEALPEKTMRA